MKNVPAKSSLILAINLLLACGLLGQQSSTEKTEEDEGLISLDPYVLNEVTSVGYGTSSTSAGSRFNVPILDLSNSVISVNREIMQDSGSFDSYKALQYVSGLGPASTVSISAMTIRGFSVRGDSSQILDGLPGGGIEQETEFLDRFEVVKGPAGSLYGQHSVGGLVNRIYKVPLAKQQTLLGFTYDSLGDTVQGTIDETGPIDKNGVLRYRVVGVFRDGETVSGGADEKQGILTELSFTPKNGINSMWLRGAYRHVKTGHETPSVFYDNAGVPSTDIFGPEIRTVPTPNNEQRHFTYVEFGTTHSFGESILGNWNLRFVTRYFRNDNDDTTPDIIPIGFSFLDADGNVVGTTGTSVPADHSGIKFSDTNWTDIVMSNAVTRISGPSESKNWGVYLDLTGDFKTGPVSHRMLVYSQFRGNRNRNKFTNFTIKEEFGGSNFTNNFVPANAFSLVRQNTLPESTDYFKDPVLTSDSATTGQIFSFGFQDNLSMAKDRILLVGGARFDDVQNGGVDNLLTGVNGATKTQQQWVGKFGAVVKPFADVGFSLFYNYSQTFLAQFGEKVVGSGELFDNLKGDANEVGVKLQLFNSSLVMTASYYDDTLQSLPVRFFNPATGLDEFTQGGDSTASGWDLDLAWQVNKNISFLLGMGNVDSKDPTGGRIRNVQNDFNYKFLGRYRFTEGSLKGLTTGISAVRISDRIGSSRQDFVTQGYTLIDSFVYYDWGKVRIQFNAFNLGDKSEVISSIFSALAIAENPRNYRVSLSWKF